LLFSRAIKTNPRTLLSVSGLILGMELVFVYYLIMPAFDAPLLVQHWMDFLAPIGLGGLWLFYFLGQLQRQPLWAANDPNLAVAQKLRAADEEDLIRERALAHG